MTKHKFLVVCDGGNVRSQALSYVLHDLKGHESIAIGRQRVSKETLNYFCEWADIVVVMQSHMQESIDPKYSFKLRVVDVGEDNFGVSIHPVLFEMVKQGAEWLLKQLNNK